MKIKKRTLKQIFSEEDSLNATYNTDLIEYLKRYDSKNSYKFMGVIMKDQVKKLKKCKKCFYIVNYDESTQSGSHWVGVVKNGTNVYFFGSYGISPLKEIQDRYVKANIYYNDKAVQETGSSICGHLVLNFIEHMIEEKKTFKDFIVEALKHSNRYKNNVLNNKDD